MPDTTFLQTGNLKKSETELTASVLKRRSKTHKKLKERFLVGRNKTKRANFRRSPLFQATYNIKKKKAITSTYLVSFGSGRLAEGKGHETDSWSEHACQQIPDAQPRMIHSVARVDCRFFFLIDIATCFVKMTDRGKHAVAVGRLVPCPKTF